MDSQKVASALLVAIQVPSASQRRVARGFSSPPHDAEPEP